MLSVIAITAAAVVGYGAWKLRSIDRSTVALDDLVVAGGPRNYLVVGSDTRAGGDPNDPGAKVDHQPLADTIMILRVDPSKTKAMVLSLPRDLWVTLSGSGKEGRINAAYAEGHQPLIDTIRTELNIPINHYLEVDFKGFQQVVTAIDGVPMWFDRAMRDRNSGLDVLHPGCTTLDGYGALAFARARHLQYYEKGGFEYDGSGDLGRISRQQLLMRRVISRAKTKGLHNPLTLKRLVDVGASNITIDDTLAASELVSLAKRFSDFNPDELLTYTLPTSPRVTSGGAKVEELDTADAQPMLDLFRDPVERSTTTTSTAPTELFTPLPPGQVDADIRVLNSSGNEALTVDVADALVARGFAVKKWGNGSELGHPSEPHTVVRYAAADLDAARTVAAWVAGGATVEEDASMPAGIIGLFVGADYTGLATPSAGASSATSTPATTTTTTTSAPVATTVPQSSEVVGMVPMGDPPSNRECG